MNIKKVSYYMREKYREIKSKGISTLLKLHLYKKEILDYSDIDYLESKWPYKNPECVSQKYKYCFRETTIDLSIIIPLYNSYRYLDRLVNMLEKQETQYLYEIIFINDGSKDETLNYVQEIIKDKPQFRCINQENGGISKARNRGIAEARGEYLSFIDHDDEISEDYVQKLLVTAIENNAQIVKCSYGQKYGNTIIKSGKSRGFVWGGGYIIGTSLIK